MRRKTINRSVVLSESTWIWHNIRVMNETTVSVFVGRWTSAWVIGICRCSGWQTGSNTSGNFVLNF